MSTANDRLEELRAYKENLITTSRLIREEAGKDILIDNVRLDDEAIRTPKLHNRWLSELSEAAFSFKKIKNSQKKLELERWKYYNGKQTDQYYAIYGMVHEKSLKTDLDKYLNADDFLIEMNEIVEVQSLFVEFLEKTVKDISNRGFAIGNAISWRKFEAGS